MQNKKQILLAFIPSAVLLLVVAVYFFCLKGENKAPESTPHQVLSSSPTASLSITSSSSSEQINLPQGLKLDDRAKYNLKQMKMIEHLFELKKKPQSGDWLLYHPEKGQTFMEFLADDFIRPSKRRKYIYLQPIGEMDDFEKSILVTTKEFIQAYYCLEVKEEPPMPKTVVPKEHTRGQHYGREQLLSGYILREILRKNFPADAVFRVGYTPIDLWPGEGWNFVFGEAFPAVRTAVWSTYRNGDDRETSEGKKEILVRTMKIASHEIGHLFGINHCTKYECNMCGCNNRAEGDRNPIHLCPECVAKVCWACRTGMLSRYIGLKEFYDKYSFKEESKLIQTRIDALKKGMDE